MQARRLLLASAGVLFLWTMLAVADRPTRRPERQKEFEVASLVARGEVRRLTYVSEERNEDTGETPFILELKVAAIDKGTGPKPGDFLSAHGWRQDRKGGATRAQSYLPQKGDPVRLFLQRGEDGYDLLYPNGIEALRASTGPSPPSLKSKKD
jgi:hypothetical protein